MRQVDRLWQFADDVRAAPVRGWWAYAARFERTRRITAGGVRWRLTQTVEFIVGEVVSRVELSPVGSLARRKEQQLRAQGVLFDLDLGISSRGHLGGWWLAPGELTGSWRAEWLSDADLRTVFSWLDGFPKRAERPPARAPRFRPPPRSDRATENRVWQLVDAYRHTDQRDAFFSFGLHRRTRETVAGVPLNVDRVLWGGPARDPSIVHLHVSPEAACPVSVERRVVGWLRERGWRARWETGPKKVPRFLVAFVDVPRDAPLWTAGRAALDGVRLPP